MKISVDDEEWTRLRLRGLRPKVWLDGREQKLAYSADDVTGEVMVFEKNEDGEGLKLTPDFTDVVRKTLRGHVRFEFVPL